MNVVISMSENKRFKIYIDYDDWSIIDTTGEYVAEDYIEWMSQKQICDLLNEQEEEIQRLKIQLQTDDICNKCKHEYLVQQNDRYYISKCKKGFDECSKGTIKYCKDFELKGDD